MANNKKKRVKTKYDLEPVYWCPSCLSLHIKTIQEIPYCETCGNTTICEGKIDTWIQFKKGRNHTDFIDYD